MGKYDSYVRLQRLRETAVALRSPPIYFQDVRPRDGSQLARGAATRQTSAQTAESQACRDRASCGTRGSVQGRGRCAAPHSAQIPSWCSARRDGKSHLRLVTRASENGEAA